MYNEDFSYWILKTHAAFCDGSVVTQKHVGFYELTTHDPDELDFDVFVVSTVNGRARGLVNTLTYAAVNFNKSMIYNKHSELKVFAT
jgi:hypothetical protein